MQRRKNLIKKVILILLVLLSVTAGIPKILQMPQELAFLKTIGFSGLSTILLGFTQVVGGALLIFRKTRFAGSIVVAIALAISTVAIFASGNTAFGIFSILPIFLAGFVAVDSMKPNSE